MNWGEFHKHLTGPGFNGEKLDRALEQAAGRIDFSTVLCYPFKWYRKGREGGIREESVGHYDEFDDWWKTLQRAATEYNDPGEFVTFPAYEWHGNRTRWGDHNVLFKDEGAPLSAAWSIAELYETHADREALILPHHTAYQVGNRGKDWSVFEPDHSPVMEIFSSHGCSESDESPTPMTANPDMGPRTSGGTFQDGLEQGHRVGAIAGNDGPGVPGSWNKGITGVWATALTRDGIWDAVMARRTFGTTGDRIELWWEIDSHPMGAVIGTEQSMTAQIDVDCPRKLDRIDLLRNGSVYNSHDHRLQNRSDSEEPVRILIEFGWGPNADYGDFRDPIVDWSGSIRTTSGTIERVQPRVVGFDQSLSLSDNVCTFDLTTARGDIDEGILREADTPVHKQGIILEIDPGQNTELVVSIEECEPIHVPLAEAREATRVVAFEEEARRRLRDTFELGADEIENPDIVYHNARKVRIARAHPRSACRATVTFDLPQTDPSGYYYVRASQVDGQTAWSSPIWIGT